MSTTPDTEQLLAETDVDGRQLPAFPISALWRFSVVAALLVAGACCVWNQQGTVATALSSPPRGSGIMELAVLKNTNEGGLGKVCPAAGENCFESQCCAGDGMQCYGKDANWAECRYECIPGRDPTSLDKGVWSCDELGSRTAGEKPICSKGGEDCTKTGCCADAGMQCFEKVEGAWATCKASCTPGLDLTDADAHPWSCKALGPRTPNVAQWVYDVCAAPHSSCVESGCCSTPGMQCYEHDQYYGECMEECSTDGWDCTPRGYRTPQPASPEAASAVQGPVADWVAEQCAQEGDNCKKSTCCAAGGMQCFAKNKTYGSCRASCDAGPNLYDEDGKPWSCEVLGPRTPGYSLEPWETRKNLSNWVESTCGEQYSESCVESRCCKKVGDRCFEKNKDWATCMPECEPGHHKGDTGGNWSCKALGPETHRAYPSLFCYHVLQATGPEPGLVGASMGTGAGIWECDKYALFSTTKFTVGEGKGAIETNTFEPAEVVQSKDGTAGNAKLFMNVWQAVKDQGMYKEADWTIKVDPDAVLLAFRLRKHLDVFNGQKGYVVNCAKPYMPEGPMMFGALEAISRLALDVYFWKHGDCENGLPWQEWGEDLYMGKCLEKIGVDRLNDWQIYSDGVCRGVDCGDPDAAAFHPMKDVDSWRGCLEQTRHPHDSAGDMDENAPQWFKEYMATYR